MLTAMGENSLDMSSRWVKCSNVQTGLKNKGNYWVYRAATLRQNPSSSFLPKRAPMCILFAQSIIYKPIMGCVCMHPFLHTLFNNNSVVSHHQTDLRWPRSSICSGESVAISEHHYASDTAPRGESSRCTLWRCASHFRYLSQLLHKTCDAAASL